MATVDDRLMPPDEAAEYLGVSLSTLSNWRVLRIGPAYTKAGRLIRYRVSALVAYLASRNVGTSDQPLAKGGVAC
ncbi:MAG: helix-turn-helix domain-containing protein [Phycisphaeraceae bacterium]|nr:MAG: helix-turn-helix domain-containing protein [Phycisphaeraceae bacterium]